MSFHVPEKFRITQGANPGMRTVLAEKRCDEYEELQ